MNVLNTKYYYEDCLTYDFIKTIYSGQTFNWNYDTKNNLHIGSFSDFVIILKFEKQMQKDPPLIYWQTYPIKNDFSRIADYFQFDLVPNYKEILNNSDPFTEKAIKEYYGMRLLNQDIIETTISFILSQNRSIILTKSNVNSLKSTFGKKIYLDELDRNIYLFPSINDFRNFNNYKNIKDIFRELKLGYRANYIYDLINSLYTNKIQLDIIPKADNFQNIKSELLNIKGIGNKVADCILTFGYGYKHITPIDIWGYKVIVEEYGKTYKKNEYQKLSNWYTRKFKKYTSLIGLYHFEYKRNKDSLKNLPKTES